MLRSASCDLLRALRAECLAPALSGFLSSTRVSQAFLHTSSNCGRPNVDPPPVPKAHGSTVVLIRGGFESAALLGYWEHWSHGHQLHPLFVELGHKAEQQQLRAAKRLCQQLGLDLSVLNAGMLGHELERAQGASRGSRRIIPNGNLLLMSLAASYAAGLPAGPASHLAMCISQDDLNTYSSTSTAFLRHADAMLATLDPPLQLLTPLARLSRWQIVKMGEQVGTPWKFTYSCLEGGEKHCGRCSKCQQRREAFKRAGIEEPWGTYEGF